MVKVLRLYNSFTNVASPVRLSNKLVSAATASFGGSEQLNGSLYVCGPTVYANCHVGHAINYIRVDLFRKFLRSVFNVNVITVMNVTDIDDKILAKTKQQHDANNPHSQKNQNEDDPPFSSDPSKHPFKLLSQHYYNQFLAELSSIRVEHADLFIKVTDHIGLITQFISKLERLGNAYVAANNDVYFNVKSIANYKLVSDQRKLSSSKVKSEFKANPQDFALWKAHKPGEPAWNFYSESVKRNIPGRPGWHVQCSAIASSVFGKRLDFHFGGKDLLFPHHYNELACSCCYNEASSLDPNWSSNWLHSGHLVIKDEKMSKSIGNVVAIEEFVGRSSINALRLLCISSHYRSDVNFSQDLLNSLIKLDHKINAFGDFLVTHLNKIQGDNSLLTLDCVSFNSDLNDALIETKEEFVNGLCDDFDLSRGLHAILQLTRRVYSMDLTKTRACDIATTWHFLKEWCNLCGLDYGYLTHTDESNSLILNLLTNFRESVRQLSLAELKESNKSSRLAKQLLNECDTVRSKLDTGIGKVIRDQKS